MVQLGLSQFQVMIQVPKKLSLMLKVAKRDTKTIIFLLSQRFNLGSISSMFYEQLLHLQIRKAQKTNSLTVFLALLGSACVKAVHRRLMKLTPVAYKSLVNFQLHYNFMRFFFWFSALLHIWFHPKMLNRSKDQSSICNN